MADINPDAPDIDFEVTREDLKFCLEYFEKLNPLDIADESYAAIKAEANKIQELLKKENLTQEEMASALEGFFLSLHNALYSRDYIARDMENIDTWYAEEIDESLYREDSLAALKEAMQNVHALLADPNSNIEELNTAYQAVYQAILNLDYKTVSSAKGLLGAVIQYFDGNPENCFYGTGSEAFRPIFAEIKAVYTDKDATDEELSDALLELIRSAKICGLSNTGVSGIAVAINNFVKDTVKLSKYPEALVTEYRGAIGELKKVLSDKEFLSDKIIAAVNRLGSSVDALFTYKLEEEKPKPKPPIVKPDNDKKPNNQSSGSKNPATGDASNTALPLAVLGLSAVAVALGKKKDK